MPSRESHGGQRIDVAGPTALGEAIASTRDYARDQGLDERANARLCIIVEELITNLCEHGICDSEREIGLELSLRDAALTLVIEDNGSPFDPRLAGSETAVPERGGGAGLRLVNAWAEIVSYETRNGRNRLELLLPLTDS